MLKAFRMQLSMDLDDEKEEEDIEEIHDEEQISKDTYKVDEVDFDSQEMDHDLAFIAYLKRASCMSHTLQLIVHKFDEIKSFKRVLAGVHG